MRNIRTFAYSKAEKKSIKSIQFGLFSPQEIKNLAVCEIITSRINDEKGNPISGGINDLRMGSSEDKYFCSTCRTNRRNNNICPGHFGYIRLAKPVFHVGFIKEIVKILRCICYKCHRILFYNSPKYEEISQLKNPETRNSKIYNICKTQKKCKAQDEQILCNTIQPKYKEENLKIKIDSSECEEEGDNEKIRYLYPFDVLQFFENIPDDVFEFLGYNLKFCHPKSMIIQNLLVCPPSVRPSVSVDSFLRSQDDLTHQYIQIIKANEEIKNHPDQNLVPTQDKFYKLQFLVATLMNNELSCGQATKKNDQKTEPIKSIYSRIKGKEGIIRGNLMGKRVDFSARTVISPDPNLEVDEVGVPISIAMNMTVPETVTIHNKDFLKELVKNGPNKYPGAKFIFINNKDIIDLRFGSNSDKYLEEGNIVERHMLNGDYVIFNRQPSLHKMSMMGHRVHVLPYKTFRLNLSVTSPYNADFDGDEMNLHLPQNIESIVEIKDIMSVEKQIISPQSNRPVMGIVQDTLIGCKLFTSRDTFLDYEQIMNLIIWIKGFNIENLPMPCILKPKALWSGKQIFSLILPKELNLIKYREEDPKDWENKLNLADNFIQIKDGELLQGIICKKTVGTSSGGIIHKIWIEISPKKTIEFLGNCQKIINNFLLLTGWTIGISDIICDSKINKKIENTLKEMKEEINKYLNQAQVGTLECQPGKNMADSFELKANDELNKARDDIGKLVQDFLSPKNHLKNMVSAGSKGNYTNISQIIALVGQQNVDGKRIPFNFKNRTLPHFVKDDYNAESKGFVENSFLKGLNPQEFFFHAMGGREGIIDTAVKTSQTGYISRRLEKCLEDIMIKYDGTVRNSSGKIIQFLYGEDGFGGEFIENQNFETLNMDDQILEENFKFIENNRSNNYLENLKKYIKKEEIEDISNQHLAQIKIALDEEFEQIKKDRDYMRENLLTSVDNSINIPVNIKAIITLSKQKYKINDFSKSDLNPLTVINKVKELKGELKMIKGNDIISIDGQKNSLTLFNMVLNYSLSTKKIIINHRLNNKAFEFVLGEIKSKFEKSKVCPGEMVGSIAAQSIAEPATQMTLNTFHLAGVSSINVTLGVPRLIEIFNVSKNLKTPSMNIYLNIKEGKTKNEKEKFPNDILKLISKIEYTPLINILSKIEIYYDPDIFNSVIEKDKEMIENCILIEEEKYKKEKENLSKWVLRMVLKNDYLSIKMKEIEEKIYENFGKNMLIIHSTEKEKKKIIHIRLKASDKMKQNEKEQVKTLEYLKEFSNCLLFKMSCSGIKNIKKVYSRENEIIKYNKDTGGLFPKNETPKEFMLETDGTNLLNVFEIEEIDFKRTISNDIYEVSKVLGIEAARKVIIKEIRKVLDSYGIYINYRHISILADFMTQRGDLTAISRFGLGKSERSPLRKATFEESVKKFLEAATFSQKDELKGVSENILLGKKTQIGTGSFELLFKYKDFKKLNTENHGNNDNNDNDDNNDDNSNYQTPYIRNYMNGLSYQSEIFSQNDYDLNLHFSPNPNKDNIKKTNNPYIYMDNNSESSNSYNSNIYNTPLSHYSPLNYNINNIGNNENNAYTPRINPSKSQYSPTNQFPSSPFINPQSQTNFPQYFPSSPMYNIDKSLFLKKDNDNDEEDEEEEEEDLKDKKNDKNNE